MKRSQWIENGLLVLLLASIILCGVRLLQDDSVFFQQDVPPAVQIPLEDCTLTETPIDDYAGVRRTYSFTLPSDLLSSDNLVLNISYQYCTVRIGGETRYVYRDGALRFLRTSGRYWSCVSLSAADAGKTAEVELTPVFDNLYEAQACIGPIERVISDTMRSDLPLMLLGLLCIFLGVSLGLISLFTVFNRRTKRALLCLSVLTVEAGIWKVASLPITALLLRSTKMPLLQPKALNLYGMIGFLLIPVLIIQYLHNMQRRSKALPETLCAAVAALNAAVVLILQLAGILELQSVVPFLMAEGAVLMIVTLLLILRQREMRWLICFPVCACADLLVTYLDGKSRHAVLLMLCIMVSDFISGVTFVRKTIRQQSELREARATALLSQIRPHFIHNTLTSIYYLCDSDPQTAKRVVRDFNSHLRANFTSLSVKTPIPFDEELEHVRAYLSVEQVRFSDKLFVEYDTPHTAFRVPALTLQPLVENAVKHNVDSSLPPVHIRICSLRVESGSKIVIEDDGVGLTDTMPDEHGHVGLQNVADRLQMLCGGTLTVSPRAEGGTVVTVFIPDDADA